MVGPFYVVTGCQRVGVAAIYDVRKEGVTRASTVLRGGKSRLLNLRTRLTGAALVGMGILGTGCVRVHVFVCVCTSVRMCVRARGGGGDTGEPTFNTFTYIDRCHNYVGPG